MSILPLFPPLLLNPRSKTKCYTHIFLLDELTVVVLEKKNSRIVEPESSSQFAEEPTTGPYSEPGEEIPHLQLCFFKIHFNIIYAPF
jgi:phosphopantothenoylcysteine synthetase/decarboxylase